MKRFAWNRGLPIEFEAGRGSDFEKGDLEHALADLEAAIRIEPNDAESQQGHAWILATSADPKIRNGQQAVASATRACELTGWKIPHGLATLAAAYSETGDFAAAVQCQQQAIGLLPAKDPAEREYRRLLDRYKAKKPYHRLGVLEEIGLQGAGRRANNSALLP